MDINELINSFPKRTPLQECKCVRNSSLSTLKWEKKTVKSIYKLLKKYWKSKNPIIYISNIEQIYPDKCPKEHPNEIEDTYCKKCDMYVWNKTGCSYCDVSILLPMNIFERIKYFIANLDFIHKESYWPTKNEFQWIFEVQDTRFSNVTVNSNWNDREEDKPFLACRDTLNSVIQWTGSLPDGLGEMDLENAIKAWFKYKYDFDVNIKWVTMCD